MHLETVLDIGHASISHHQSKGMKHVAWIFRKTNSLHPGLVVPPIIANSIKTDENIICNNGHLPYNSADDLFLARYVFISLPVFCSKWRDSESY